MWYTSELTRDNLIVSHFASMVRVQSTDGGGKRLLLACNARATACKV